VYEILGYNRIEEYILRQTTVDLIDLSADKRQCLVIIIDNSLPLVAGVGQKSFYNPSRLRLCRRFWSFWILE